MFRKRILEHKFTFLGVVIFVLLVLVINRLGVVINITPSMDYGVYIKLNGPIRRGDIVAFCLPEPYKTVGLDSGYIPRGTKCDGVEPLIKKVLAVPGDRVVLSDDFIAVNGVKLPYQTFHFDSHGRPMNVFPRGVYESSNGFWFIGIKAENSWDSRYWGDVGNLQILKKIRSIIIL